ncbi:hypothetical protein D9M71_484470 [compost metagenome]
MPFASRYTTRKYSCDQLSATDQISITLNIQVKSVLAFHPFSNRFPQPFLYFAQPCLQLLGKRRLLQSTEYHRLRDTFGPLSKRQYDSNRLGFFVVIFDVLADCRCIAQGFLQMVQFMLTPCLRLLRLDYKCIQKQSFRIFIAGKLGSLRQGILHLPQLGFRQFPEVAKLFQHTFLELGISHHLHGS